MGEGPEFAPPTYLEDVGYEEEEQREKHSAEVVIVGMGICGDSIVEQSRNSSARDSKPGDEKHYRDKGFDTKCEPDICGFEGSRLG